MNMCTSFFLKKKIPTCTLIGKNLEVGQYPSKLIKLIETDSLMLILHSMKINQAYTTT